MSEPRKPRTPHQGRGEGASPAVLRARIGQRLREYEQVITDLTKQLEASHRENREMGRDESLLRRVQVEAELLKAQRSDSESRWQASLRERRDLQRALSELEQKYTVLDERSARLEQAIQREREDGNAARAEVACLEQQVEQLRSIVELLIGGAEVEGSEN